MNCLYFAIAYTMTVLITCWICARNAPEGIEDETGYHDVNCKSHECDSVRCDGGGKA